jgi:hypothetical protein
METFYIVYHGDNVLVMNAVVDAPTLYHYHASARIAVSIPSTIFLGYGDVRGSSAHVAIMY